MSRTIPLLLCLLLVGCKVGPNYRRPAVSLPQEWDQPVEGVAEGDRPEVEWWKRFNDPTLDWLVGCALKNNYNVAMARARIREARAHQQAVTGKLLPSVDGRIIASRERFSPNAQPGGVEAAFRNFIVPSYIVGFDASWEVDLFGGLRRDVEAACADVEAAISDGSNVVVSLLGEVGRNYVAVRGFQKRIKVTKNNIKVLWDVASIAEVRYEAGLANKIDNLDASSLACQAAATIPRFEEQMYGAIFRLSVLLGCEAGALVDRLIEPEPLPIVPTEIPIGKPCDLLANRPDVQQAEWQLRAASARVGAAIAALYPSLNLSAFLEMSSVKPGNLFDWMSRMWVIDGLLLQPLFHGWQLRAEIKAQWAAYSQAAANYRQIILVATEEVRNALVAYDQERRRYYELLRAMENSALSRSLSLELYTKGLVNFLFVLNSETAVTEIDDALVETETQFVQSAVALYKAMGGCWTL